MSFTKEKRAKIKNYLLELLDKSDANFITKTVKKYEVTRQTIYKYLRDLESDKIIKRNEKNKKLELIRTDFEYLLHNDDLQEDVVFKENIYKHVEKLPDNLKMIWRYGFTEMLNNAIDHSESKKIFCFVTVNYVSISIYILDSGVGIFDKIREHYELDSLKSAIIELLKGKLTTDSAKHSGEGIFFTSRMFDRFFIFSSQVYFKHYDDFDAINRLDFPDTHSIGKGTVVMMKLSNSSKRTTKEVFDMFASTDGGFTKTEVRIKDTIDNDMGFPVSRSEAKRLYNRFEKFENVILDFNDISDIGQGYAHELFVVFKTQHPNVKMQIKNANSQVKKMINHVKRTD